MWSSKTPKSQRDNILKVGVLRTLSQNNGGIPTGEKIFGHQFLGVVQQKMSSYSAILQSTRLVPTPKTSFWRFSTLHLNMN